MYRALIQAWPPTVKLLEHSNTGLSPPYTAAKAPPYESQPVPIQLGLLGLLLTVRGLELPTATKKTTVAAQAVQSQLGCNPQPPYIMHDESFVLLLL